MKLVLNLVAGILAGLLLGLYAPEWVARVLFTAKTVIGQLITFTIPLIILFFIMSGIASLPKNSGKLLGKTVGLSYCSTILAGLFAFTVASNLIPHLTTAAEPTAESCHQARLLHQPGDPAPVRGDVGTGRRLRVRHRHQRHPGHRPAPGRRSGP